MKKVLKVAIITVLAIIGVLTILPFVLGGISGGFEFYEEIFKSWSVPNPPKPEITYGEFPIILVYEVNGEENIIEDTLICEYDGVSHYGSPPIKERMWKHRFKRGRLTLLQIGTTEIFYDVPGIAYSQMGDGPKKEYVSKDAYYNDTKENPNFVGRSYVGEEEVLEKYGIRIISWEIAPPIVNSFK